MSDTDFETLRLGFNRSNKKAKTSGTKKNSENPADIDGYAGPWGFNLRNNQKISCGPSEVILILLFLKPILFLGGTSCPFKKTGG